ncbi:ABC transporter ATP-binding protein [soil metagenome]
MHSLISVRDVTKHFVSTGEVVSHLNLEIPRGQFVSLLGPSGCGKSTVLRLMAGLETADSGTVRIEGNPRLSFVFQDSLLLPWRSAFENVRLPLELANEVGDVANSRASESLARVGLGDASEKLPHQLSGGMKMRVSLARALVTQPDILFLDEPFSALDEITREGLQADLRRLWSSMKMTVVFVTHSMSEAAFLAERQIVFSQRPAKILRDHLSGLGEVRDDQTRLTGDFTLEVRGLREALA